MQGLGSYAFTCSRTHVPVRDVVSPCGPLGGTCESRAFATTGACDATHYD